MKIDNAEEIDVVINMYDFIEYSENHSQNSGSLQLYYRDQPTLDDNGNINDFAVNDDTRLSFKYKKNVIVRTGNDDQKKEDIWVPLKYLSNLWRTFEKPLINCENDLILTWSEDFMLISGCIDNQTPEFAITDTKLSLSTEENVKLLGQLKSGFKNN